jgi:hypothetical protein
MNSQLIAARLEALRAAGIAYDDIGRGRYRVGPGFTYWPATDRWRCFGDHMGGYGVKDLIKAVRERVRATAQASSSA